MAKTVKSMRSNPETEPMQKGWRYEFAGILLVAVALLSIVSLYLAPPNELTPSTTGILGNILARSLTLLAGDGRYLMAVFFGVWGLIMILQRRWLGLSRKLYGFLALFLCVLTFLHMQLPLISVNFWEVALQGIGGGLIGAVLTWFLVGVFGDLGSYIVLGSILILSILCITNQSLVAIVRKFGGGLVVFWQRFKESAEQFLFVPVEEESVEVGGSGSASIPDSDILDNSSINSDRNKGKLKYPLINRKGRKNQSITPEKTKELELDQATESNDLNGLEEEQDHSKAESTLDYFSTIPVYRNIFESEAEEEIIFPAAPNFVLPSLSLLKPIVKGKNLRQNQDIKDNIQVLEETLENFGVKAKVVDVQQGPAITRYEIHPAPGIKVSKIINLADDISLSMAAEHVRIEAPIPGKSAIGIEVPNREISAVHLREVLENDEFQGSTSRLSVAFGKDIAGRTVVGDLAKMPHLLIAGATGMGKSVCLNSLIASILFKSSPQEVKLLMIDPKMVELTTYNGIPHLITPVVTSPKKAAIALRWAVTQMEKRYEKFAANGAKDIIRYNKAKLRDKQTEEVLPYLVIIIDELADLMMIAPADVEDAICRLAQMARAAGIHLVIATQRPSVDVITGLIKANIPSRIAFAVSSQTDSRTILDTGGAEKLVGRGDMLYLPVGFAKPVRVQGAFISDDEVDQLVNFLKQQEQPKFIEGVTAGESKPAEEPEEEEALFPDAVRLFIETGQASISLLQRRFRIGYTRAARLIDLMEKRGIVGPFEGSKPREVLLTIEQFENRYGKF